MAKLRDQVFRSVTAELKRDGNRLTEAELRDICRRVRAGVGYLSGSFTDWWKNRRFENPVDVGFPGKDPYTLIIDGFGLPYIELSSDIAFASGFMPKALDSDDEKAALNAFWNRFIREFREDPVLQGVACF